MNTCIDCGKRCNGRRCRKCRTEYLRSQMNRCPGCGKPVYYPRKRCLDCQRRWQHTDEYREMISRATTGVPKTNLTYYDRGGSIRTQNWTPEMRESARQRGLQFREDPEWIHSVSRYGPDAPGWKGGISQWPYARDFNKFLRRTIRNRDGNVCRICGATTSTNGKLLHVHHIDFNKKHNEERNLITLCSKCHGMVHREKLTWQPKLSEMVASSVHDQGGEYATGRAA